MWNKNCHLDFTDFGKIPNFAQISSPRLGPGVFVVWVRVRVKTGPGQSVSGSVRVVRVRVRVKTGPGQPGSGSVRLSGSGSGSGSGFLEEPDLNTKWMDAQITSYI